MRKVIGYVDNRFVYLNEESETITVQGTWIMITGANENNCMELANRNLKNFSPIKLKEDK